MLSRRYIANPVITRDEFNSKSNPLYCHLHANMASDVRVFASMLLVPSVDGPMQYNPGPAHCNALRELTASKAVLLSKSRQVGASLVCAIAILHHITYNVNKTVAILGRTLNLAGFPLEKVEELCRLNPGMVPKIATASRRRIFFENGCRIYASALSSNCIRGMALSMVVVDEWSYIRPNMLAEFMSASLPVIHSCRTRLIVTNTGNDVPHGLQSLSRCSIGWRDMPGRDDAWAAKMYADIGERSWSEEFAVSSYQEVL